MGGGGEWVKMRGNRVNMGDGKNWGNGVKMGADRGIPAVAESQYFITKALFHHNPHASTFLDNYSQLLDQFRKGVEKF